MIIENIYGQPLPAQIDKILHQFVEQSIKEYAPHIRKIILFGSYARGDFKADSDIDVMVLVDYPRDEVSDRMSGLSDISFDIGYHNDFIELNPIMQNIDFFDKWVAAHSFYKNVINEGVSLYENG